jgi:hypothetical protein
LTAYLKKKKSTHCNIDRSCEFGSVRALTPGVLLMTMARSQLVDVSVTRWYHCITRCVRRAFLLGEEPHNRKKWIENRTLLAKHHRVSCDSASLQLVLNSRLRLRSLVALSRRLDLKR